MNPLLRMGCAASGSREKAFTIVVGTALELLTDWRGGGVVGIIDPIPTGSLVPSSFSRGFEIEGIACVQFGHPKIPTSYGFEVYMKGPSQPGNLVADIQGMSIPVTLTFSRQTGRGSWVLLGSIPNSSLYINWAPGVTRTVTLRWE